MNDRILLFRIGAMMLATFMIAALLVLLFMGSSAGLNGTYTIYVKFSDAPGVTRNTPVRKSGIRIGYVSDIHFVDNDTAVLATLAIDKERRLYDNEYCQDVSTLLIGDAALEFVRDPNVAARKQIVDGDKLQGRLAQDPSRALDSLKKDLAQTMATVETAGRDVHNTLGRVDRLIAANEDRIGRVIGEADQTLQLLQVTLNNGNELLGDQQMRTQIRQTVAEMPLVMSEARATVAKAGVTIDKATNALVKASETIDTLDTNLRNLEGLTKPLGDKGDELVTKLDDSLDRFDSLMTELNGFTKGLNDPHGTVGLLIHDPELYNRANHIARNVEQITQEVQPILDDARTFSDKIARDPGVLGVRGVLEKNNHLKGKPAPYDRSSDRTQTISEQIDPYNPE